MPGEGPSEPAKLPALTVDGVVFAEPRSAAGQLPRYVLLIQRGCDPFRGRWAFPGGFVEYGEDLHVAVAREIAEETGLHDLPFRQFRAYGDPRRDPRGHTVSVVFVAELDRRPPEVRGGDDAAKAAWFSVDRMPELAFDHQRIFDDVMAVRRQSS